MRVLIISDSYVTQEPRVLRQVRTFAERSWAISIAGYPGRLAIPASWDFHDLTVPPQYAMAPASAATSAPMQHTSRPRQLIEKGKRLLLGAGRQPAARPERSTSELITSLIETEPPRGITHDEALEIFFKEPKHVYFRDVLVPAIPRPDLVVTHDYHTLPLAECVARQWQVPFVIDIHEYAVEQYNYLEGSPQQRYFRHVTRPLIEDFHATYFPRARGITTVCEGISRQLLVDHLLAQTPAVVRSTPFYSEQPFRPTGETIDVLYHGIVQPNRHLEVGIRSLALWRPEFRFTIRGPGPTDYIDGLKELARSLDVADRLSIEPPVPFDDLIGVANRSDVGYLAFMNFSRQRQFASPNKYFEYIMAGLALVVMDTPELAPNVRQHNIGRLIREFTPEAIAAAINGLDRRSIDAAKQASLKLAKELNWEQEQHRMIAAYGLPELETAAASGP